MGSLFAKTAHRSDSFKGECVGVLYKAVVWASSLAFGVKWLAFGHRHGRHTVSDSTPS